MKKRMAMGVYAMLFGLLFPRVSAAQGTVTFLSSLSASSTGSADVASDSWLAAGFGTGNNVGGYALNSVELGMLNASGNPSAFTVMLYSMVPIGGGVAPGSSLGALTGSADPATSGTYTYTTPLGLTLSPDTAYYIVVTAGTTAANGAFAWNESAFPPSINQNWGVDNAILRSTNGATGWSVTPYFGIAQFAIYATPAPEPGAMELLALGGLLVGFRRWKSRRFDEKNKR
jgi:hypothetical protein